MKPVVTILGGSTPFTAGLVEALRAAPAEVSACELRLFGQDESALESMKRYGERRLAGRGWTVSATRILDEAVGGAAVVLNQIRYGGLDGRARDEALANQFGLAADETLGPCGLVSALRVAPRIRALAAELGRLCKDAWVLNLSNPLSITTTMMLRAGAPRKCVGLCELPLATAMETCRLLGISIGDVEWQYVGLNHRGFIFSLAHRGEELMPRLPELLGEQAIFGVTAADIKQLGALPLKYFRLSANTASARPSRRSEFLTQLKDSIARELDGPVAPPPSLSLRQMQWYELAVAPMIAAIFADDRRRMIVNCIREDGLVAEVPARISRDGFEVIATQAPAQLKPWLDRWSAHERALLEAVESPDQARIERALSLDPSVPPSQVRALAGAIRAEQ